jgi:hypothetical protein
MLYRYVLEVAFMSTVVASRAVRPPKKPRKGELHQVHVLLPGELVALIDQAAEQLGREASPWAPQSATRTETIKALIAAGLRQRGLLK